jgi:hypothetical protein
VLKIKDGRVGGLGGKKFAIEFFVVGVKISTSFRFTVKRTRTVRHLNLRSLCAFWLMSRVSGIGNEVRYLGSIPLHTAGAGRNPRR